MKRLIVVPIAALALLAPGSAAAKGPAEAKITGPGLNAALTIKGMGEGDASTDLGLLVQDAGFFPQVFGQTPSPLLANRPTQLGPRYLVTYTVPGSSTSTLEQELSKAEPTRDRRPAPRLPHRVQAEGPVRAGVRRPDRRR